MGTAIAATTGFERDADKLLRASNYEPVRRTGSNHLMYKHRYDASKPHIRVPSTPKNPSESLVHIGHAIKRGSATHVPQGKETDITPQRTAAGGKSMGQKLVDLATPHMLRVAEQKKAKAASGDKRRRDPDPKYNQECGKWIRRCLETYGKIHARDFAVAAEELALSPSEMSAARSDALATAYKLPGTPKDDVYTDFVGRIPRNAVTWGGRNLGSKAAGRPSKNPVTVTRVEPTPPNGNEGRRLDQGGLTPDEHAAAERRMVDAHRRAEDERAALLAERRDMQTVQDEQPNGRPKSQLDAAMELLREAALADTHALTPTDLQALSGLREMHRRHANESTAAAGMITRILERVAPGTKVEVAA